MFLKLFAFRCDTHYVHEKALLYNNERENKALIRVFINILSLGIRLLCECKINPRFLDFQNRQ